MSASFPPLTFPIAISNRCSSQRPCSALMLFRIEGLLLGEDLAKCKQQEHHHRGPSNPTTPARTPAQTPTRTPNTSRPQTPQHGVSTAPTPHTHQHREQQQQQQQQSPSRPKRLSTASASLLSLDKSTEADEVGQTAKGDHVIGGGGRVPTTR